MMVYVSCATAVEAICPTTRPHLECSCPVPAEQVLPYQQQAVHTMLVAVSSGCIEDGLHKATHTHTHTHTRIHNRGWESGCYAVATALRDW